MMEKNNGSPVKAAEPFFFEELNLDFEAAAKRLEGVVRKTPLERCRYLSDLYKADVYLKREDLQIVRSYKLRGAYNMMSSLSKEDLQKGVVCASAGNHAQGFAFSCNKMKVQGIVFMPVITPGQKISHTKLFGGDYVEVKLVGDTYDECAHEAKKFTEENGMTFIPAFDHPRIIEGQGTVGLEIFEELKDIDYLFLPIGGGGLASGVGVYFKLHSPQTKVIGAEPQGAPSLVKAFENGGPVTVSKIDTFVDGAAVKRTGDITYKVAKEVLDDVILISEGKVCSTLINLYNEEAIVAEPAGALSMAALDDYAEEIRGKKVVCVVSGGNNDISRMSEMQERALIYEGLKYYFLVNFAQRPGALKDFVNDVLTNDEDIVLFEYVKKNNRESGPALVGIVLKKPSDHDRLIRRMNQRNLDYKELKDFEKEFKYLV